MTDLKEIPIPILVTGANGMLGSDIVDTFSDIVGEENVLATDYDTLDITRSDRVREFVQLKQPKLVINAAAYTDVDKAEVERDKCYLINTVGPQVLARVCHDNQIPLVHFTTDFVFSGEGNRLLTENDIPNPPKPNYYAETKLWGEREVMAFPENLIIRVQWLYGRKRDRFTILRDKTVFTPFMDQYGAPTSTKDLSKVLVEMVQKGAKGLYHYAYDDYATWADVYEFVKEELGVSTELIPKKSEDVSLPARRPRFTAMSNQKLKAFLGRTSMGSWKDSLRDFLRLVN